jgi:hypothetical protein
MSLIDDAECSIATYEALPTDKILPSIKGTFTSLAKTIVSFQSCCSKLIETWFQSRWKFVPHPKHVNEVGLEAKTLWSKLMSHIYDASLWVFPPPHHNRP